MTWLKHHYIIFTAIWLLAVILRINELDIRPFHVDEAVNGLITGNLLAEGSYTYNPGDYHGPVLYYLTLPLLKLAGIDRISDISESMLRLLPALAGSMLVLLLIPLRRFIPARALLLCAFLLAISPILVYYSRYYIHEMLLVFFIFGLFIFGYIYLHTARLSAAIWAGLYAGMAISTKETWIIILFAVFIILISGYIFGKKSFTFNRIHIFGFTGMLFLPVALFYSSFLFNPGGLAEIPSFVIHYFERAGGEQIHHHPFGYYFNLLFLHTGSRVVFPAETGILILAAFGLWLYRHRKYSGLVKMSGSLAGILFLIFSVIPYKTPWNIACMMPPFILFISLLLLGGGEKRVSWPAKGAIVIGIMLLCIQMLIINFRIPADPDNPYTYAQSGEDVLRISSKIRDLLKRSVAIPNMMVIAPENAYWPLPWYFREWEDIGWWDHLPDDFYKADILVLSRTLEKTMSSILYEQIPVDKRRLYVFLFNRPMELYPGNTVIGMVNLELWENDGNNDERFP